MKKTENQYLRLLSMVILVFIFKLNSSYAFIIPFGFFKNQADKIAFSTASHSMFAGNCSTVTTLQYRNASNVATNVASDLTISLAAIAGVTYFSDSTCLTPITEVTIAAGTSSANFFFLSDTTGTKSIVASLSASMTATQDETVSTNPYIWTGGGANALWSTAANWSGGAAPISTSRTLFNSTCASNCSPSISANMTVNAVRMVTGYSGTITQGAGFTVTIGSGGWVQQAGTFAGGNSAVTQTGPFVFTGGTYTATSGTMTMSTGHTSWTIQNTPTFNGNTGTIFFSDSSSISHGSIAFSNLTLSGTNKTFNLNGGAVSVTGNLTFGSTLTRASINSGTLLVAGNVSATGLGASGTFVVQLTGTASGQTVTGTTTALIPNFVIAAGTNNVVLSGTLLFANYTVTSVGTLTTTGSTIEFYDSGSITPGAHQYNNISFTGIADAYDLNGATFNIGGTLTLTNTSSTLATINSGTILLTGNLAAGGFGHTGSVLIKVKGNAAGQTIAGNGANLPEIPNLLIEAGTNNVTFTGSFTINGSYSMTSVGTFTSIGHTLHLDSSISIFPGTVSYNNVSFNGPSRVYDLNGATMNLNGNVILNSNFSSPANINSGTLAFAGNLTASSFGGAGNVLLKLTGNPAGQTISGGVNSRIPNLEIAAGTNNVTLSGSIKFYSSFTVTSVGSLIVTGSTANFMGDGTITPGTVRFNNVTFAGQNNDLDLNNSEMLIDGTLLFNSSSGSPTTVNNGTLSAFGSVSATGQGGGGDAKLNFAGTTNQTITRTGSLNFPSGNVTLNKSAGTSLIFGSSVAFNTVGQTVTVNTGSISMAGFAFTLRSLSLNSNTVTKGGGVLTVNGVVAGTGSLYGGTVNN